MAKIEAHKNVTEAGYNFWLSTPENSEEAKPAIIFLHGQSLCGNDLNKVKRYGTIDAIEKGREIDAYVIAPQNPGGSWKPEKIMDVLQWVEENYNVDTDRVYVLGMSLGGYGTLDFVATYPDEVAAAMAMCGGSTKKDLSGLNDVPLWIIHGTADNRVSISHSDRVVAAMKETDSETERLQYDRVPGMDHSRPARLFYHPDTYNWLFSHSLSYEDRPIAESFDINEKLMSEAYKGLTFSGRKTSSAPKTTTTASNQTKKSKSQDNSSKKKGSRK